ncbi:MAG: flagellar biosynthetic protein FliR, partial [Defluviitaleaceae bacterium]|nr:flagellar biosynthetic protein FliR [Defluviitaleaceae bacterium]
MAALGFLDFYVHIDVFLLIMVRLLAFLIILPVLSGTNIPMVSKVASAFVAACVVYSSGKAVAPQYTGTVIGYIYPALQEFLVGFTLGYAVYLAFSALNFAGQIIDFQIGFSMMSVFDPLTQVQAPIIGNLLTFAVSAILVQTGGLNAFLGAVFYSYEVLPLGSAVAL